MRKIRKFVAFALATMMMMAMSITAFAEEATTATTAAASGVTFTVTNLANDEETTLKIYELATPGNGEWTFSPWIPTDAISEVEETVNNVKVTKYDFDWEAIAAAAEKQSAKDTYTTTAKDGVYETSHTFEGLTGSAYLVLATGTGYVYNPMGKATYEYVNGAYTLKSASVVAKSSNIPVKKEISSDDDKFVQIGQTVTFTIKTAVPNVTGDNKSFTVTDQPTNLNDLAITKVTLAGDELTDNDGKVKYAFTANTDKTEYTVDLTDLLSDDNVGKTVIITVTGVVGSDVVLDSVNEDGETVEGYAFKNTAFSNKSKPNTTSTVIGYTGDATLTKYNDYTSETDKKVLTGAEFQVVTKDADGKVASTLSFVKLSDGVYRLAKTSDTNKTDKVAATNGTVQVIGLKEGKYFFKEVTAPEGYALNSVDTDFTIQENLTANVSVTGLEMKDTTLVQLPFTGGMGTTIFTVLGVAIMVLAAALYFVSKRRAAK